MEMARRQCGVRAPAGRRTKSSGRCLAWLGVLSVAGVRDGCRTARDARRFWTAAVKAGLGLQRGAERSNSKQRGSRAGVVDSPPQSSTTPLPRPPIAQHPLLLPPCPAPSTTTTSLPPSKPRASRSARRRRSTSISSWVSRPPPSRPCASPVPARPSNLCGPSKAAASASLEAPGSAAGNSMASLACLQITLLEPRFGPWIFPLRLRPRHRPAAALAADLLSAMLLLCIPPNCIDAFGCGASNLPFGLARLPSPPRLPL